MAPSYRGWYLGGVTREVITKTSSWNPVRPASKSQCSYLLGRLPAASRASYVWASSQRLTSPAPSGVESMVQ